MIQGTGLAQFTPMERWEQEFGFYTKIRRRIPFFRRYRIWKQFKSWVGVVRRTRMGSSGKHS